MRLILLRVLWELDDETPLALAPQLPAPGCHLTPHGGINLFLAKQRFKQPVFSVFRATLPFLMTPRH